MAAWISSLIEHLGYPEIMLLMFLENIVPPIPSEAIMPLAGFTARRGELQFWGVILAGTAGSLGGAIAWYLAARAIGTVRLKHCVDRHCRWLGLRAKDVERADQWFDRYGHWAVLIGRMVPGLRTVISLPAGLSEMPFPTFLLYSLLGTAGWSTLLASLGWFLSEQWEVVGRYVSRIGWGVGIVLVLTVLAWLLLQRRALHRSH